MIAAERFNLLACLTVALSCLGFLLADDHAPLALITLSVTFLAWANGRASANKRGWALPAPVVSLLVLAAVVYAALGAAGSRAQPVVSVLGLFLVFITMVKLFDRRSARDDAQLLTLSVFVVIASVLTSNSLQLGLVLIVLTPIAISAVMLWQIRAGQERHARAALVAAGHSEGVFSEASDFEAKLDSTLSMRRQLSWLAGLTTLGSALVACVIFVIAPRGLASDVLGRFGRTREATIGFTDQARLGMSGFLRDDPTPVMDVAVSNGQGINQGDEETLLYLRGAVKETYDAELGTWREARDRGDVSEVTLLKPDREWVPNPGDQAKLIAGSSVRIHEFTLRGSTANTAYLFSSWKPASISVKSEAQVSVTGSARVLKISPSLPNTSSSSGGRISYTVKSILLEDPGEEPPAPDPQSWSATIRALANTVLTEAHMNVDRSQTSNRAVASAIRDYLRTRYTYSLEMVAPAENQDPLEMFLFETRRGHCEYFASAMVALCQSSGIAARLVLGYVTGEYNSITGQYIVRESNAHAWCEVHIGQGRWITMDASPPADIERIHRPEPGVNSTLRRWWDALEVSWARSVVSFDSGSQVRLLGRRIASASDNQRFEDISGRLATMFRSRRGGESSSRWSDLLPAVGGVVAGAVMLSALGYVGFRVVRAFGQRRSRATNDHLAAYKSAPFFRRAERMLARANLERPLHRPPIAHARSLIEQNPAVADPAETISRLFYIARFAGRGLSEGELARGEDALKALAAALKARDTLKAASHAPTPTAPTAGDSSVLGRT